MAVKKINIEIPATKTKEIEVSFPLFLKGGDVFDSGGWYDTFEMLFEDGVRYKITINHDDEWEYECSTVHIPEHLGYCLEDMCSSYRIVDGKEFYEKLDEFIAQLNKVPRQ